MRKLCHKCDRYPAHEDNRYCKVCIIQIRKTLKKYLTPFPPQERYRSKEEKEILRETKFGVDSGVNI